MAQDDRLAGPFTPHNNMNSVWFFSPKPLLLRSAPCCNKTPALHHHHRNGKRLPPRNPYTADRRSCAAWHIPLIALQSGNEARRVPLLQTPKGPAWEQCPSLPARPGALSLRLALVLPLAEMRFVQVQQHPASFAAPRSGTIRKATPQLGRGANGQTSWVQCLTRAARRPLSDHSNGK